jgi:isopentenyl-diphosphate delta-isomerase type 1
MIETEWFDIVDEENRVIGKATREQCHDGSKLLHPVVHVHIFNSDKKLLLQKRNVDKDIQPGKWDTSIGGHIQSGELVEDAIRRESLEEAGIAINHAELLPIAKYVFESDIEKELVFSYAYAYDGPIIFQESEIDEVRFFDHEEVTALIASGEATPNFVQEFSLLATANHHIFAKLGKRIFAFN